MHRDSAETGQRLFVCLSGKKSRSISITTAVVVERMTSSGCRCRRTSRRYVHYAFAIISLLVWSLLLFSIWIVQVNAAPSIWRRLVWKLRAGTTLSQTVLTETTNTTNSPNDNTTTSQSTNNNNNNDRVVSVLSPTTAIYNSVVSSTTKNASSEIPVPRQQLQRRAAFLDRIALISSKFLRTEHDAELDPDDIHHHQNQTCNNETNTTTSVAVATADDEDNSAYWDAITPQSDLIIPGRHFHVVTTATLPWFTGTAVNPLLRAAYLHRHTQRINSDHVRRSTTNTHNKTNTGMVKITQQQDQSSSSSQSWVTLVIPWLELPEDQETLYNGRVFASSQEQEEYIREWLRTEAKMPDVANELDIVFYPARYHDGLGSIFAMGDIMDNLNNNATLDVCILEEPEHCNWYAKTKISMYFVELELYGSLIFSLFFVVQVSCTGRWLDQTISLCCWNYTHE